MEGQKGKGISIQPPAKPLQVLPYGSAAMVAADRLSHFSVNASMAPHYYAADRLSHFSVNGPPLVCPLLATYLGLHMVGDLCTGGHSWLPEVSGGGNHDRLEVSEDVLDLGFVDSNHGGREKL